MKFDWKKGKHRIALELAVLILVIAVSVHFLGAGSVQGTLEPPKKPQQANFEKCYLECMDDEKSKNPQAFETGYEYVQHGCGEWCELPLSIREKGSK